VVVVEVGDWEKPVVPVQSTSTPDTGAAFWMTATCGAQATMALAAMYSVGWRAVMLRETALKVAVCDVPTAEAWRVMAPKPVGVGVVEARPVASVRRVQGDVKQPESWRDLSR